MGDKTGGLFGPEPAEAKPNEHALCQYFMPEWAAALLMEKFFPDLTGSDLLMEPGCGYAPFLKAVEGVVPGIGVEIDPVIAEAARAQTAARIVTGDYSVVELPTPTAIAGNPPFGMDVVRAFLNRSYALLPENGRAGFVLPAHTLQLHNTAMELHERWSIQVEMIPRSLFPLLSKPLVFAMFTKERVRRLVGMSLYLEARAMNDLPQFARVTLQKGRPRRSVWRALVRAALERLGGEATTERMYEEIEDRRPTENPWWREKVRQCLQKEAEPVERGRWRLRPEAA
jgi:hypothetical protein